MPWLNEHGRFSPRPSKKSTGRAQQTKAHRKRKTRR